jgi:proline dehydrogenase
MLRTPLLYLSKAGWAHSALARWGFARRAARRFVAGESIQEAVQVAQVLNRERLAATLAHLGEEVVLATEADQARLDCEELLRAIEEQKLGAYVSVKLTQIGLRVNFDLCMEHMLEIARVATLNDTFVRIDMEESNTIDQTLSVEHALRRQGLRNVGLVFQSYLPRSERDLRTAVAAGIPVRIVKGAYQEPESVAFQKKAEVDASFDRMTEILLEAALKQGGVRASKDGRTPPLAAIATHDPARIQFAETLAERIGLPKAALEFQLLFGIRSELQRSLRDKGYPVRIYVPYGAQWYPYLMRRLAERPANLWFFVSNLVRR